MNVISGQLDIIVDALCTEQWINNMTWAALPQYRQAKEQFITIDGIPQGAYRSYQNFAFFKVFRAGHSECRSAMLVRISDSSPSGTQRQPRGWYLGPQTHHWGSIEEQKGLFGMADRGVLLFGAWTLGLVSVTVLYRVFRSLLLREEKLNAWPRGTKNSRDASLLLRVSDAHANCIETLPVFLAVVLAAHLTNRVSLIDSLASYVFPLRVLQTLAHLAGTGQVQVFFRANFFLGQVAVLVLMSLKLL